MRALQNECLRAYAIQAVFLSLLTACSSSAPRFQNPSRVPLTLGTQGRPIVYVVMGDSTAAGEGAPYEAGIAIGTARHLGATRRVALTNVAISGATVHDVRIEQLPFAERLQPDVVLISVCANDVTHLTPIGSIRADLLEIVHRLKRSNAAVFIVLTGSPDMGAPPRIPAPLRPLASWQTRRVNAMVRSIVGKEQLELVPLAEETGPIFRRNPSLFDVDRFHPNAEGYAIWTALISRSLDRNARNIR